MKVISHNLSTVDLIGLEEQAQLDESFYWSLGRYGFDYEEETSSEVFFRFSRTERIKIISNLMGNVRIVPWPRHSGDS